jgi:hypothetical protein
MITSFKKGGNTMSQSTARYILHKHGLIGFSKPELFDLLDDRFNPLPDEIKMAILTIKKGGLA